VSHSIAANDHCLLPCLPAGRWPSN